MRRLPRECHFPGAKHTSYLAKKFEKHEDYLSIQIENMAKALLLLRLLDFFGHTCLLSKKGHVDGSRRLSIHCPKSMYCKYLYSRKKNACILVLLSLFEKLIHSAKMSVTDSVSYRDLSSRQ